MIVTVLFGVEVTTALLFSLTHPALSITVTNMMITRRYFIIPLPFE